jgi:hypothetical protein
VLKRQLRDAIANGLRKPHTRVTKLRNRHVGKLRHAFDRKVPLTAERNPRPQRKTRDGLSAQLWRRNDLEVR